MANRVAPFNTFAGLAPPWSLPNLDANFTSITSAFNDASLGYANYIATDTGSANNYVIAPVYGSPSGLNAGMRISFNPANSNTGASTLTVNPLASAPIVRTNGSPLVGGEIIAGSVVNVICDGTSFRLLFPSLLAQFTQLGTITGNQTVSCVGASSLTLIFTMNWVGSNTITFQKLAAGVPIFIYCNSLQNSGFIVAATNPAGVVYSTISLLEQGVAGVSSQFTVNAGKSLMATGITTSPPALFLMGIQSL